MASLHAILRRHNPLDDVVPALLHERSVAYHIALNYKIKDNAAPVLCGSSFADVVWDDLRSAWQVYNLTAAAFVPSFL